MKGVTIVKAKIVSDDKRRTIYEIMNGQLNIKNMKILKVKKGKQLLETIGTLIQKLCIF